MNITYDGLTITVESVEPLSATGRGSVENDHYERFRVYCNRDDCSRGQTEGFIEAFDTQCCPFCGEDWS